MPKSGPPTKLSPRDKRDLARLIRSGKAKDAVDAAKIFNQDLPRALSTQTIRNALRDEGLVAKKKKKKPKLTRKNRKARLKFARDHQDWTIEDWKRVIWSDETKINRIGSDGNTYCWVDKDEGLSERTVSETVKFGGGSVMAWGCMTWAGAGKLIQVVGRMNADQFIDILDRGLVPTLDACAILPDFPSGSELIFQQDNDPKHTSMKARAWFANRKLKVLDWPSQSPDLNPIEHLWSIVKLRLRRYPEPPKGVLDLWPRVEQEWAKITPADCQALVGSMVRRIEAVIKAKGGWTKY